MMKRFNKKENLGITLIALVITIVVLIILATVVINLSLGNNGLFNKAKYASQSYKNAQNYEETEIAKMTNNIDSCVNASREENLNNVKKYTLKKTISTVSSYGLNYYDLDISSITTKALEEGLLFWGADTSSSGYNVMYYRIKDNSTIRVFIDAAVSNKEFLFTIIK